MRAPPARNLSWLLPPVQESPPLRHCQSCRDDVLHPVHDGVRAIIAPFYVLPPRVTRERPRLPDAHVLLQPGGHAVFKQRSRTIKPPAERAHSALVSTKDALNVLSGASSARIFHQPHQRLTLGIDAKRRARPLSRPVSPKRSLRRQANPSSVESYAHHVVPLFINSMYSFLLRSVPARAYLSLHTPCAPLYDSSRVVLCCAPLPLPALDPDARGNFSPIHGHLNALHVRRNLSAAVSLIPPSRGVLRSSPITMEEGSLSCWSPVEARSIRSGNRSLP